MFSRRAAEQEREDNGGIEGPGLLESSLRSVGRTGLTGAASRPGLAQPLPRSHSTRPQEQTAPSFAWKGNRVSSPVICMEQDSVIFSFSVFVSH